MIIEKSAAFYRDHPELNCAEALIYGANEAYGLELTQETLNALTPFGGGMGVGTVCGAYSGALATLGIMITSNKDLTKAEKGAIAKEFNERFVEKWGPIDCKSLKEKHWDDDSRCQRVVEMTAEILDEMIKKYK